MKKHIPLAIKARRLAASLGLSTLAAGALSVLPALDAALDGGMFAGTSAHAQRANSEQREPPPTRSSQTLSRAVYTRIEDVMEARDEEDYEEALDILGEIRDMYEDDRLNDREKYTMWLFYASIAQARENYPESVQYYREILNLPNLTQEQLEQTLFMVGQLEYVLENYEEAIEILDRYLNVARNPDEDVYLRIGTAYYQLERYQEAEPYILRNMEAVRAKGEMVAQSTYGLLRAIYLSLEQYENARETLREMVVLFNQPDDWGYLGAIEGQLENFQQQAYVYWTAYHGAYLDSESRLMNLAFQLYNNDNPYGAAEVISKGMEEGIVEENESNLSFLSQAWQIAREDERAAPPLERAAEMSDDGELYYRLGRIYMAMARFEDAIEAFRNALEQGGLDRPDQLYLQMARAFMELNRYDEGLEAAREARQDERSRDTARSWITVLQNEKERYLTLQERRERYKDYF